MSIYDKIQERLGKGPAKTPAAGEAAAAADVLRAKTGKATSSTGPGASNVAEQAAVGAAQTAAQQQSLTGKALAQQVADRARALRDQRQVGEGALATEREVTQGALRTEAQASGAARAGQSTRARMEMAAKEAAQIRDVTSRYDRILEGLASNRRIQEAEILSQYEKGNAKLDQVRDQHELHMIVQAKALANKQYIQKIMQVGAINRLEDSGSFESELQRLSLGEGTQMLIDELGWQASYNASARDFAEEINDMDLDQARQVADRLLEAEVVKGVLSGGADIGESQIKAGKKADADYISDLEWEAGIND